MPIKRQNLWVVYRFCQLQPETIECSGLSAADTGESRRENEQLGWDYISQIVTLQRKSEHALQELMCCTALLSSIQLDGITCGSQCVTI